MELMYSEELLFSIQYKTNGVQNNTDWTEQTYNVWTKFFVCSANEKEVIWNDMRMSKWRSPLSLVK